MGGSKMSYGVLAVIAMVSACTLMAVGVAGQGPAAAPSPDCNTVVFQLADCLDFVSGTVSTPSATCCSNLSSIITTSPQCLCQLYNTTFTEPLGLNVTRALMLPPACKLTTPDPSLCSVVGIPVSGPVAGPVSSAAPGTAPTPTTPSSAPTPQGATPPSSVPTPSTAPLSSSPPSAVTPPTAELTPPTTTSPPSPNSASLPSARSFVAVTLLLGAFTLGLH